MGGTSLGDEDTPKRLKNWEYIGQCYDVLKADPIDLNKGRTGSSAFRLDDFENIPDGTASKPVGTKYEVDPGGSYAHKVLELSSLYDYRRSMSDEASLSVADPTGEAFSSSLSGSFTSTRDDTEKNDSVVTYTSEKVTLWDLDIRTDDQAPELSEELAAALAALPTAVSANSHAAFLTKFGTHYAQHVVYGGRLTQRILGRPARLRVVPRGGDQRQRRRAGHLRHRQGGCQVPRQGHAQPEFQDRAQPDRRGHHLRRRVGAAEPLRHVGDHRQGCARGR